ncbi:ABC-2 type transport system ATP-binding protein [Anaerovirgula multivorans]|uniref:ABC-2 type transport system ATP-binding protein n=1 Tax=Anaerovirgula multivorans TaxID=312168 RepID=A0A239JBL2_9FIRM|nr:ABC transporter ATP-binding protein [Anaerovirgula multivorans]SNT03426.1 ABC-2 type transport system ATP-binding protein [Anaerovirgula multivorans]
MNNILEVSNLSKEYKDFKLKNINFSLEKGYIMGFIGPNGAGKSTTIKLMMNLVNKDAGEIKVFGLDYLQDEKKIKSRIGFVYDESHYYEELTVEKNKKIIAPFYRHWDENTFQEYLNRFDIDPKKKVKQLSKGTKMKFSLAVALSHKADLIIMDEPTSGLDPIFRREILDILYSIIQDETKSIFFSTHITTDLDKVADYITFIDNGSIVFSKSKDEILDNYGLVKGGLDLLNDKTKDFFLGLRKNAFGFEGLAGNIHEVRKAFNNNIIIEKPTLEDIMVYTVRGR